ncbi:CheY chemotaxis protein or a CheY-like REC (receiver) domain [bacterium A37T11]|nr:CheY chemotaxis protein or a CheY-like REC (receiver) domain [bacterium A37T11]
MKGLKLLILGDKPENITSMERLLDDIEGLDVLSATTEEEAVKICLYYDVSIILMDKHGSGVYRQGYAGFLSKIPNQHEPTILAVTDHGLRNSIGRSSNSVIEYLYRPIDDSRIKTKVKLLVQLLQARRLLHSDEDRYESDKDGGQSFNTSLQLDDGLVGKRALLAEDNELNSFMVVHMLNSWGMEADVVSNGKDALEQLMNVRYDIILMDTHMPVMGGYDTMNFIRNSFSDPLNKIPIISLSASVMEEEQEAAKKFGANDVVGKPFHPDMLHEKILSLLG